MNIAKLDKARKILASSEHVMVLTGAGLSAASGIPTFRGKGGLWKHRSLMKYAFAETFVTDPEGSHNAHETARQLIDGHEPNAGHYALRELAHSRKVDVFTQNADGYHERAGQKAYEIHGTIHALLCPTCGERRALPQGAPVESFACATCGSKTRHDVVWFGESVRHVDELNESLREADTVLLIGTSGLVTNTWDIARFSRGLGKSVIEVNPSLVTPATLWTTVSLRERAEIILPQLVA